MLNDSILFVAERQPKIAVDFSPRQTLPEFMLPRSGKGLQSRYPHAPQYPVALRDTDVAFRPNPWTEVRGYHPVSLCDREIYLNP